MQFGNLLFASLTRALGAEKRAGEQAPMPLAVIPVPDGPTSTAKAAVWPTETPTSTSGAGTSTRSCVVNPTVATVTSYVTQVVTETVTTTISQCDRVTTAAAPAQAQQSLHDQWLHDQGRLRTVTLGAAPSRQPFEPAQTIPADIPSAFSSSSRCSARSQKRLADADAPRRPGAEAAPRDGAQTGGTAPRVGLREILDMVLLTQIAGLFVLWLMWARVL